MHGVCSAHEQQQYYWLPKGKSLYSLIATFTSIPLHFHDGEPSDQCTGRSAHTTATRRMPLPRRVIAFRWRSWLFFHPRRRKRRRSRMTIRTRTLDSGRRRRRSGLGIPRPPFLLSVCVWSGGSCDHMWREDVVECYAAVVSSSLCRRAIAAGGRVRGRCVVGGGGYGGWGGRALCSRSFAAHWLGEGCVG